MREIKFRAWDIDTKKMFYKETPDKDSWYTDTLSALNYHLHTKYFTQQYTGLKDINGNEIFEGDIVYIAGKGNTEIKFPFIDLYEANMENDIGEIVGNIYENNL